MSRSASAICVGFCISASTVQAASLSLTAVADNTLYQSTLGNISNGVGPHLFVGTNSGGAVRRAVLRFDETAIPGGAFITSAELTLNLSNPGVGPYADVSVHRVLGSWGEGTSNSGTPGGGGAVATAGDATWLHRFFDATPWNTAGGDFSSTATLSFTPLAAGANTTGASPALANDVQAWRDGTAANNGWLLKLTNESTPGSAQRYDSKDNTPAEIQPKLSVVYQIAGDATADDAVNLDDFTALASNFGLSNVGFAGGDFNRDGAVSLDDFTILASNFGATATRSSGVPEPMLSAPLVAGVVLLRRRHAR